MKMLFRQLFFVSFCLLSFQQVALSQCNFEINVIGNFELCENECSDFVIEVADGQPPYSFTWSDGSTGQTSVICSPGDWCVTVTDSNGESCEECFGVSVSNNIPITITGPDCIPPGSSGTLTVIIPQIPSLIVEWTLDGISVGTAETIVITENGNYCVTVFDNQNGCQGFECFNVGAGGIIPNIEAIAGPVCENPDTLLGACQKVCTNSTITYLVTNADGAEVEWTIDGSDDFEINDDQVTVTWGEAGFGEITASIGSVGTPPSPLYIECGQLGFDNLGTGFIFISGGTGGYLAEVAGLTLTLTNGVNQISGLEAGVYTAAILDLSGNVIEICTFVIEQLPPNSCLAQAFPTIIPPTSCDTCNGAILIDIWNAIEPISYFWSGANGFSSNEMNVSNLCAGNYSMYFEDELGCTDSIYVSLDCGTQNCYGESSICVEVLEDPEANFTTDPLAAGGVLEVCKGQPINFFNQSIGESTVIWDFGDFTNSVLQNPIHTYPDAGTYEVSLIARNDCFCGDTTFLTVNVLDLELPEIKCTGTVCKGETVTYETDAQCNNYNWIVTGIANILEGGGSGDNFVTVEWIEGPEGTVELNVIDCSPALCDATTVEVIPIITDDISLIEGPDKVCPNDIVQYSITDFGGVDINWTVTTGGNILEGQGTSQITVEWVGSPANNPYNVSVNYENCYLECSGSDNLTVNIRSEFYVSGIIEVCQNSGADYAAIDATFNVGVTVNWEVFNSVGVSILTAGPSPMTTIDWSLPVGDYTLHAIPNNGGTSCTPEYIIEVKVVELPPLPVAITGEDDICPGTAYNYSATGLPEHEFHWMINNGGIFTEDYGDKLNVTWGNNPPYELLLSQISPSGLQCESDPITMTMNQVQTITITGEDERCKEEIGTYSAESYENLVYNWTITPANAGTIISGEFTESIQIQWDAAGAATVSLDVCGLAENFNVTVHALPEPVVNHPVLLCPFEKEPVSTTVNYAAYEWRGENDELISTEAAPELGLGYYEVIVTDANGCVNNEIFDIKGHPQPNISISTPSDFSQCSGFADITLYAIESSFGYTYQWYLDDVAIGTGASTIDISESGSYWVVVIDDNGCSAASNVITITACEDNPNNICINGVCFTVGGGGGSGGTPCVDLGNITFDWAQGVECNVIDFQNTSTDYIPGTLTWYFDDPESGNNTATGETPSHAFTRPGFFKVWLDGLVEGVNGDTCSDRTRIPVMVPAAADFLYHPGCIGEPINFFDRSTFLPLQISSIDSWEWDFGDPASGAANTSTDENPTHIFPDDGEYTVTLTIITNNGCMSTVQLPVSVHPLPEVSFNIPDVQCQLTSMNFVAITDAQVTDVEWNFDDPASGEANTSEKFNTFHTYDLAGDYTVSITARNIYGCIQDFTLVVPVTENLLSGTISPPDPDPICEGDNIDLTAPAGGTSWVWSTSASTEMINVTEEGVYSVTITDNDGCTFSPTSVAVEILPAPIGTIRVVEYNEFGQATGYFDDNYAVCEGEDVYLFAQTSADYGFEWSNMDNEQEISFTEDKFNLLPAGTHEFTVTITNNITGCTSVAGPLEVIIHPTPNNVQITSMPGGPLCDGAAATLSVVSPDASLEYVWNTGEFGTSIMAFAAGEYWVRAINDEGCEGESNRITIENAPDINKIPSGYHVRCKPDTLCLPDLPTVVSYQWYFNGVAIPAPEGTVKNLIAQESGEYTVEMTDIYGCTVLSNPICLELYDGFGTISGSVYFDVNENGVIDGPDTLVSNVAITLVNNGVFEQTNTSNSDGFYAFPNILSTDYDLLLNGVSLPQNWFAYQFLQDASLDGCDDEIVVDFLLYKDCNSANLLEIEVCEGMNYIYEGEIINIGETKDFTLVNQFGCDSLVTVAVDGLPTYNEMLEFHACEGEAIVFNNQTINAGVTQQFMYQTFAGCDSMITVQVNEVISAEIMMDVEICQGETTQYNGETLDIGETRDFVFADQYGCDSTITVNVMAFPEVTFNLLTDETCWNADDGKIEVVDIQGGDNLEFSINGLDYQPDAVFENLESDVYTVTVRDANGCTYQKDTDIPTIQALELVVENTIIECDQEGINLSPKVLNADPNDLTWNWSTGSTETSIFAENGGVYNVEISNQCETIQQDIEVGWGEDGRIQFFHLPNVFSPNGDGYNDSFQAYLEPGVEVLDFELKIFNRWGSLIHESKNHSDIWDGVFNGELQKTGVYVVFLQTKVVACGREIVEKQESDITILR